MPINDFHPFEESELLSAGMKRIAKFRSGHVQGAIYVPPGYDPNGEPEQCKTRFGCIPALDFDSPPPPDHAEHVERVTELVHDKLLEIGDID